MNDVSRVISQALKLADKIAAEKNETQSAKHKNVIGIIRRLQKELDGWTNKS